MYMENFLGGGTLWERISTWEREREGGEERSNERALHMRRAFCCVA
jgi:hypothetical protein